MFDAHVALIHFVLDEEKFHINMLRALATRKSSVYLQQDRALVVLVQQSVLYIIPLCPDEM